jgi:hypothetical protein
LRSGTPQIEIFSAEIANWEVSLATSSASFIGFSSIGVVDWWLGIVIIGEID